MNIPPSVIDAFIETVHQCSGRYVDPPSRTTVHCTAHLLQGGGCTNSDCPNYYLKVHDARAKLRAAKAAEKPVQKAPPSPSSSSSSPALQLQLEVALGTRYEDIFDQALQMISLLPMLDRITVKCNNHRLMIYTSGKCLIWGDTNLEGCYENGKLYWRHIPEHASHFPPPV